jgi:hypothetical protein
VIDLANSNYVVSSPAWNNVAAAHAGAVTWATVRPGPSDRRTVGPVGPGRSLLGSTACDLVGASQENPDVTPLANDNYVASLIADVTGYFP